MTVCNSPFYLDFLLVFIENIHRTTGDGQTDNVVALGRDDAGSNFPTAGQLAYLADLYSPWPPSWKFSCTAVLLLLKIKDKKRQDKNGNRHEGGPILRESFYSPINIRPYLEIKLNT